MVLEGHQKGVISFSWTTGGQLISGSWDGTAKVWTLDFINQKGSCVQTLGPHENGVHVLGLSDGNIATTSTGEAVNDRPANFKLRIWDGQSGRQIGDTMSDHLGPIRSIASVPGLSGMVTCSNDGSVMLRGIDGSLIDTMMHPPQEDGTPPFVLDCVSIPTLSGLGVVSCGEDGSVLVWEGSQLVQCIMHPACVWCAVGVPGTEGDFITGGNDGVLRYFSRSNDAALVDSEAVCLLQRQFEEQVAAAQTRKRSGPSNEEIEKQVRWELRSNHPGKSDGQVMVFNKEGKMIAAQWSADSSTWIEIGEVTGNSDGGMVGGTQYDHVFPVEIDGEGGSVRSLNIGYNNLESPFDAAQRFINENGIGQHYLRQIAEWITARAGKNAPTLDMASASRGYGHSAGPTSASAPFRRYQYFPLTAFAVFDDIPTGFQAKILPKIVEFNTAAAGGAALSAAEMDLVDRAVGTLTATSHYHSSAVVPQQVAAVAKLATAWPADRAFPGYDLCRLLALHPAGARALAAHALLPGLLQATVSLLRTGNGCPTNSAVTALRFLANTFRFEEMRRAATTDACEALLSAALAQTGHASKLVRLSAATLLLNCVLGISGHGGPTPSSSTMGATLSSDRKCALLAALVPALHILLTNETESADAVFRAVQAMGTVSLVCKAASGPDRAQLEGQILQAAFPAALTSLRTQWGARLGDNCSKCLDEVVDMFNS